MTRTDYGYADGEYTIHGADPSGPAASRYAHMRWTLLRACVFVRHFRRLADIREWIAAARRRA